MLVILSKKTDYNTKVSEIESKITSDHDHDKHITTQEFNKLTSQNITARLKQANLTCNNDLEKKSKKVTFKQK